MINFIRKTPLAVSGLLLAILSLSTIYTNFLLKYFLVLIGLFIFFILFSKLIFYNNIVKNELNQLIVVSTLGTFSMALMLISTYLIVYNNVLAYFIWVTGIIMHVLIILLFTYRYILQNFNIENVYGSYWVVYVGITMASITGLSFNLQNYTWIFFVFGFCMMIPTFLIVTYRYIFYPVKENQNKPLICIYAALFNILIVGYLNSFVKINSLFVLCLYLIATICYIFSLFKFLSYRKLEFYPSYSAYSFPFVISAIASTKIFTLFPIKIMNYVVSVEIIVATLMVCYVFIKYVNYLFITD